MPGQGPAEVPTFPMSGRCLNLPGSSLGFQVGVCSLTGVKEVPEREGGAGAGQEGLAPRIPHQG